MAAYNVERLRGPLGLFGKKCGQIASGESLQVAVEPVWIDLKLDGNVLTIRSVAAPVEVKFGADARRLRPKVLATLDSQRPEITTTRPLVSIKPRDRRGPRYVIWKEGLTNGEVLASIATDKFKSVHDFYEAFTEETEHAELRKK